MIVWEASCCTTHFTVSESDSRSDAYRGCTAVFLAEKNGFDVIAVRVQHKSGVVARMAGTLPGRAVGLAPVGYGRLVKRLYHGTAVRLEPQVMASSQGALRSTALGVETNNSSAQKKSFPLPPIRIFKTLKMAV